MPEQTLDNILQFPQAPAGKTPSRIPAAFLPFVGVPFVGEGALWAYARLALYGGIAYLTFEKHRKLSYLFMGAAGLSTLTSLGAKVWTDSTSSPTAPTEVPK